MMFSSLEEIKLFPRFDEFKSVVFEDRKGGETLQFNPLSSSHSTRMIFCTLDDGSTMLTDEMCVDRVGMLTVEECRKSFDRAVELYDRLKAEEAAKLAEDERVMNELIEEINAAMSKDGK